MRWRLGRKRPAGSLMGLLIAVTVAAALGGVPADPVPAALAGGAGEHSLRLTVAVNTRPGLGALRPGIRVGDPVVKTYRLVNSGEADLQRVRLTDPAVPTATIRCRDGAGRPGFLRGLASTVCTARLPAATGTHSARAVATARIPSLRTRLRASARSGYAGVSGGLSLTESARLTGPKRAEVRYTVGNPGNRTVYGTQLADRTLAPGRIDCAGRTGIVPTLRPGASVTCTAIVQRKPGKYRSTGSASGNDRTATLSAVGGRVPPPTLTAHASAAFVIPAPARTPAVPPNGTRPPGTVAPKPPIVGEQKPGRPGPSGPPPVLPAPPVLLVPPAPPPVPPVPAAPPVMLVPPAPLVPGDPAAQQPGDVPKADAARPPAVANPQQPQAQDTSLLGRMKRHAKENPGMSALAALFLLLLPPALMAVVLGSRRH